LCATNAGSIGENRRNASLFFAAQTLHQCAAIVPVARKFYRPEAEIVFGYTDKVSEYTDKVFGYLETLSVYSDILSGYSKVSFGYLETLSEYPETLSGYSETSSAYP